MAFSPPEYCRLFAQKKAYQGGVTGTPGPPPSYAPAICNKITDVLRRTVVELLRKDPSIINDEDEASNTALHLAATEGHLKCCKELLERGAEVDARLARVFFL